MATQVLCSFNKFGFCKYRETCRKRHIKETCEKTLCDISTCTSRHPRICKFFRDLGRCKFDPCAFLHVENKNSLESLVKENEEILQKIAKLDSTIKDLDEKIIESKHIQDKLRSVENKLDTFNSSQKEMFEKDSLIEKLNRKVSTIEKTLSEKDDQIKLLVEKVRSIEERQDNLEIESNEVSECEQTFVNPSNKTENCEDCDLEPISENHQGKHVKKSHESSLQCEYCDFIAKNVSGLKTHIRRMHTRQQKLYTCQYCTFTSKTEN